MAGCSFQWIRTVCALGLYRPARPAFVDVSPRRLSLRPSIRLPLINSLHPPVLPAPLTSQDEAVLGNANARLQRNHHSETSSFKLHTHALSRALQMDDFIGVPRDTTYHSVFLDHRHARFRHIIWDPRTCGSISPMLDSWTSPGRDIVRRRLHIFCPRRVF